MKGSDQKQKTGEQANTEEEGKRSGRGEEREHEWINLEETERREPKKTVFKKKLMYKLRKGFLSIKQEKDFI